MSYSPNSYKPFVRFLVSFFLGGGVIWVLDFKLSYGSPGAEELYCLLTSSDSHCDL